MRQLTEEQAFRAMTTFLERQWRRVPTMQVSDILSDINSGEYGYTADPGSFEEWSECVDEILQPHTEAAE